MRQMRSRASHRLARLATSKSTLSKLACVAIDRSAAIALAAPQASARRTREMLDYQQPIYSMSNEMRPIYYAHAYIPSSVFTPTLAGRVSPSGLVRIVDARP